MTVRRGHSQKVPRPCYQAYTHPDCFSLFHFTSSRWAPDQSPVDCSHLCSLMRSARAAAPNFAAFSAPAAAPDVAAVAMASDRATAAACDPVAVRFAASASHYAPVSRPVKLCHSVVCLPPPYVLFQVQSRTALSMASLLPPPLLFWFPLPGWAASRVTQTSTSGLGSSHLHHPER